MRNNRILCILVSAVLASSCHVTQSDNIPTDIAMPAQNAEFEVIQNKNALRTPDGANMLDLETPLRCNVNWQTQQLILTLPFNNSAFKLKPVTPSDDLPRLEVTGFTFDTMPAEKALAKLLKEADIRLAAKDAPYASISGEDLKGELTDIVNMITSAAGIFYRYDAQNKILTLSRKEEHIIYGDRTAHFTGTKEELDHRVDEMYAGIGLTGMERLEDETKDDILKENARSVSQRNIGMMEMIKARREYRRKRSSAEKRQSSLHPIHV